MLFRPVPGTPIPASKHHRWLAIVGSAGQPRDGNNAACYALFDTRAGAADVLSRALRPSVPRSARSARPDFPIASRCDWSAERDERAGTGQRDRRLPPGRDDPRREHGDDLPAGRSRRPASAHHEDPAARAGRARGQRHRLRGLPHGAGSAWRRAVIIRRSSPTATSKPRRTSSWSTSTASGSTTGSTARRCAPEEIARLGTAIALALHDLHRQDVVHLDLKPTNVLFRPNGEAVLIDFGLAHHGHFPDLLAEELRIPLGNWVYMAPEQVLGVRCDPRSDIFALGRHPLRARDRTPAVRPPRHRGRAAPAPLSRSRSAAHARARRRPNGCRRSCCAASKSTPAIAMRRPAKSRSRFRRRREVAAHRTRLAAAPRGPLDARAPPDARRAIRARALPASVDCSRRSPRVVAVAIAPQESNEALRDGAARRGARAPSPRTRVAASRASPSCLPRRRFRASARRIPPPAATSGA